MSRKKIKKTKNISEKFDFTSQDMYDKLIMLINNYCTDTECIEIIELLDKLIDYIYMYW